jgi:hypothetical protein
MQIPPLIEGHLVKCSLCEDCGWVCENHRFRPWEGARACKCGEAGMPNPSCNVPDVGETPRMPKGFRTEAGRPRQTIEPGDNQYVALPENCHQPG